LKNGKGLVLVRTEAAAKAVGLVNTVICREHSQHGLHKRDKKYQDNLLPDVEAVLRPEQYSMGRAFVTADHNRRAV
jgi:hypothetical protein